MTWPFSCAIAWPIPWLITWPIAWSFQLALRLGLSPRHSLAGHVANPVAQHLDLCLVDRLANFLPGHLDITWSIAWSNGLLFLSTKGWCSYRFTFQPNRNHDRSVEIQAHLTKHKLCVLFGRYTNLKPHLSFADKIEDPCIK